MNYQEALRKYDQLSKLGIQLGLERIKHLLKQLEDPQKDLKFIHVAGTNGKGSTSSMITNALIHSGYKTGLFMSPYVLDFRESIQCDGSMISKEDFSSLFEKVSSIASQTALHNDPPTQFEILTAIALEFYKQNNCDAVVLEVGLGGRLDSTNAIDPPMIQVLTSISMDHTGILGDTIEKIAYEKAGIIKGSVTVIYPNMDPQAEKVIAQQCHKVGSKLVKPSLDTLEVLEESLDACTFNYRGEQYEKRLTGLYQVYNAVTAISVCEELKRFGFYIPQERIKRSIRETFLPARVEKLFQEPLVLLDGSHNPEGIKALSAILDTLSDKDMTIVMGVLADKNYEQILQILSSYGKRFIAVPVQNPRALPPQELKKVAQTYFNNVSAFEDLSEALNEAIRTCNKQSVIVVCGSLYLANVARPLLIEKINKTFGIK
ncbi:MAG: folylpolyglutamate synthase/dihydrofolate synthase family protein [Filifactor alocis]|nr:folylpolyglutamate synthase/dihydrofolate synthase family protein [Filifactor alocis]